MCGKTWLCIKQRPGGNHAIRSLQARKLAANGRLLLHFHDAVSVDRWLHALQPLTLAVVSVRAFRAVAHARVRGIIVFVQFLVKNLTL